jgi:hypothetical protein
LSPPQRMEQLATEWAKTTSPRSVFVELRIEKFSDRVEGSAASRKWLTPAQRETRYICM